MHEVKKFQDICFPKEWEGRRDKRFNKDEWDVLTTYLATKEAQVFCLFFLNMCFFVCLIHMIKCTF